jgi:hypothetical protein
VLALRAALRGNPAATDRFIGVLFGTFPAEEFFAPANMRRILGRAGAAGSPALE